MGRISVIYKYKLEKYVEYLRYNQRCTFSEIVKKVFYEKGISMSSETVRRYVRDLENTVK